jgi:hypothetical protein
MDFPTNNLGHRRIGRQRPHVNGDRMHEGRCRRELEWYARGLAGPGFGLGASALHAPRLAALDEDSAGFALHLKSLFLDDCKDREDNIGSSKVLPTCTDDIRRQSKGGRE